MEILPTALVAEDYKFLNNYHIFKIRGGREDETEKRGKKYLLCNKYQDKRFQQLKLLYKRPQILTLKITKGSKS